MRSTSPRRLGWPSPWRHALRTSTLAMWLGCAASAPALRFSGTPLALAPVAPGSVRIINHVGWGSTPPKDALPAGFSAVTSGAAWGVFAEDGFPTPEAPHRVIANLEWEPGSNWFTGSAPNEESARALAADAASRGANAVVILNGNRAAYVFISPAAPRLPSAAAALAGLAPRHDGFTRAGAPIARDLAGFGTVAVNLEKGHCYGVAFALDADALWNTRASEESLGFLVEGYVPAMFTSGLLYGRSGDKPSVPPRAFWVPLGCPGRSLPVTFRFPEGDQALGSGHAVLELFRKPISDAELKLKVAHAERDMHVSEVCARCDAKRLLCSPTRPQECGAYNACVQAVATDVRWEDCF